MEKEFLNKLKADTDIYYYYVSLSHNDKEFAKFYSFARDLKNYILYKQYERSLQECFQQLDLLQQEVNTPQGYNSIKAAMSFFISTAELIMTNGKPRPYNKIFN